MKKANGETVYCGLVGRTWGTGWDDKGEGGGGEQIKCQGFTGVLNAYVIFF